MSPFETLFRQGAQTRRDLGHGRTFTILTGTLAGQTFVGTRHRQGMDDPGMELGTDKRGIWILEIVYPGPMLQGGDGEYHSLIGTLTGGDKLKEGEWVFTVTDLPDDIFSTASYKINRQETFDS